MPYRLARDVRGPGAMALAARLARMAAANVRDVPSGWFYLSFGDEGEFRGGCYVEANEIVEAIRVSIARGCNAGPETSVLGTPLEDNEVPPIHVRYRLLSKEEIDSW